MCTAILFGKYAGRNLDVEGGYGESFIITPRNYSFKFKNTSAFVSNTAIIGIGIERDGYPLYFDAANEHGVYMAGLNYVGNAKYLPSAPDKINLAPYELIPYILSKCKSVHEARSELESINLIGVPFSSDLAVAELHFFIADKRAVLVVEPDSDGLSLYENPVGVLTNNPPFPLQMHNLTNYAGLSTGPLVNRMAPQVDLAAYSRGMGALGLPGDLSSESRFVRAAFHRQNCIDNGNPCDIFHLLSSVEMPKGSLKLGDGYEYTAYSCAVDLESITYYLRTYTSCHCESVPLSLADLSRASLISYPINGCKQG